MFKKYSINHCAQKLHFLAQAAHETDNFTLSEETKGKEASSQSLYKGRGILQMTGEKVNSKYYDEPGPFKTYGSYSGINSLRNPEILSDQITYCIDSGGWMFSIFKKMVDNENAKVWEERWKGHKEKTIGKSLNELALYGDEYLELISALLNGRNKNNNDMPNGWEERKLYYELLRNTFFEYDRFHSEKKEEVKTVATTTTATDIVTYHIYADGRIEKHIPKTIKSGYEDKYKYVYHDKNSKEHNICTVEFILVDKREDGNTETTIPKGYIKTYEYPKGGNAQKAYEYSNGDIYVEGTAYGYKKYPKGTGKIELVRMKNNLSYENGIVKVFYSFRNSQRRYCNPESYAGLIGVLAEIDRKDLLCTGMCFEDATSYPSVTHPNGDSADTAYFATLKEEQIKVDAFIKFHFKKIYRGSSGWFPSLVGTKYSKGHEDHLHSGDFDSTIIKIIKQ